MGGAFRFDACLNELRIIGMQTWGARAAASTRQLVEHTSQLLGLPELAVSQLLGLDGTTIDALRARDCYQAPSNSLSPDRDCPRFPLGSASIQSIVGNADDAYVQILTRIPAERVVPTEPEDGIRNSEAYKAYVQMLVDGYEQPYITIFEVDSYTSFGSRRYTTTNRRRTLAAQQLDMEVTGWLQPLMSDTGLPMKLADVKSAYNRVVRLLAADSRSAAVPALERRGVERRRS